MFLVKMSAVPPVTVAEVEARLRFDMPVRIDAERVTLSIGTDDRARAEAIFALWAHRPAVVAGHRRTRIVEVPRKVPANQTCTHCGEAIRWSESRCDWVHLDTRLAGCHGGITTAAEPRDKAASR